ncbi:MAG: TetR/AcrR family transcriptional regulator [Parahaliea sp.]
MTRTDKNVACRSKREAIIRAAVTEFQKSGYVETSMDRISETANVSKRTVYNHFPSKEALFEAILKELVERSGQLELSAPRTDEDLEKQLLVVAHQYAQMMTSDDFIKLARVVLSRFIQSPHLVGAAITGKEPQQPIEDWFTAAQKTGLMPEFDSEQAATEFTGVITATEFWPKLISNEGLTDPGARDLYLKSMVCMFLGHYASRG